MSQLSERYATALFEVTKQKGNTQEVLEVLLALRQSLLSNKEIMDVLATPLISDEDKVAVLKNALGTGLNEELSTFFSLITKNNRLAQIPTIVKAFEGKVSQDLGVESGVVRSAIKLSDGEKQNVQNLIEKKLGKKVELSYSVDEKMIGGIEAKVGSYIFEDSIKTHMQKLNDFITRRVQ
jgi:F-type H+-transporting ATPase subunit delta